MIDKSCGGGGGGGRALILRVHQAFQELEGKFPMCLKPGKVETAQLYFCPEDNYFTNDERPHGPFYSKLQISERCLKCF